MKPFDLTAAIAGAPIQTRDGREMQFVAHVPNAHPSSQVVVMFKPQGTIGLRYANGTLYPDGDRDPHETDGSDLVMVQTTNAKD